jgi:uracil-DNA glycosylase family 4
VWPIRPTGRWILPKTVSETPGCENCPMQKLFPTNNFVPALLIKGSTRLCVGEAPGELEAEQGEPFVGTSGGWLFGKADEHGKRSGGLYKAAGVDTATVSKCNVLGCRPLNNKFPTDPDARAYISKEEAEASLEQCWNNHVRPVLTGRSWTRIDCFGDKALTALTGQTGIMRWRGSPLAVPACGPEPLTVPTLHPSYIARDQSMLPAVVSDLKKTLDLAPEHYNIQPTIEDVRAFTATTFSFDIECVRETGKITMVGLSDKPFHAMCVPFSGIYIPELKRIFENAKVLYTQNGIQFDIPRLFPELGLEWRPE